MSDYLQKESNNIQTVGDFVFSLTSSRRKRSDLLHVFRGCLGAGAMGSAVIGWLDSAPTSGGPLQLDGPQQDVTGDVVDPPVDYHLLVQLPVKMMITSVDPPVNDHLLVQLPVKMMITSTNPPVDDHLLVQLPVKMMITSVNPPVDDHLLVQLPVKMMITSVNPPVDDHLLVQLPVKMMITSVNPPVDITCWYSSP